MFFVMILPDADHHVTHAIDFHYAIMRADAMPADAEVAAARSSA